MLDPYFQLFHFMTQLKFKAVCDPYHRIRHVPRDNGRYSLLRGRRGDFGDTRRLRLWEGSCWEIRLGWDGQIRPSFTVQFFVLSMPSFSPSIQMQIPSPTTQH